MPLSALDPSWHFEQNSSKRGKTSFSKEGAGEASAPNTRATIKPPALIGIKAPAKCREESIIATFY
jgi:hypothetical protein